MRSVFVLLLLVTVAACSAPGPLPGSDAGDQADAGCADECSDSGRADAAVAPIDGGDAGLTEPDAGESPDAGERDAGAADAGCPWECGENAICVPDHRKCVCASGFHDCNGTCVPDDAVETCGGRCMPCGTPDNAIATCTAGTCGWGCAPGFHRCGDQCLPDDSVGSCGSRCGPCPGTANGTATCEQRQCGLACRPTYRLCDGACSACPTVGVASLKCEAAQCVVDACTTGFHQCGNACVPDDALASCGSRCEPCPTDASGLGTSSCVAGQCAITCPQHTLLCGGSCMWCASDPGAASMGCNSVDVCAPTSCLPGHYACSRGCCPDRFQTYEVVGAAAPGGGLSSHFGFDLDSLGRPHAVWFSGNRTIGFILHYAWRDASGWQREALAQLTEAPWSVSVELDHNDVPHVAYWIPSTNIHYATRPGGTWVSEIVPLPTMNWPQITVDATGQPLISNGIALTRRSSQGWSYELIASGAARALRGGLTSDAAGTLHAVFASKDVFDGPYFPTYSRRDATGWTHEEISQEEAVASSIAVSSSGGVHAVYVTKGAPQVMRHAERTATGGWTTSDIVSLSEPHAYGGVIVVDSAGQPVVGIAEPVVGLATRSSSGWNLVRADPWESWSHVAIRLDASDRVHLVYIGFDAQPWFAGQQGSKAVLMYVH